MEFDSIVFLFRFLPVFLILYFAAPGRMKNAVLLQGGLFFCAWHSPIRLAVLPVSILVNYCLGRGIAAERGKRAAGVLLVLAFVLNIGAWLCFYELFVYTLQILSYLVEVYRGEVKAQKNLPDFAVYAAFFPVLPAGPVIDYHKIADSLHSRHTDIRRISDGARRFVIGLAKKVLLADQIGLLWAEVRAMDYADMSLMSAWLGISAFSLRLYFALSGYADMAIGLGEICGFSLPENFRYPYAARSVTDFGSGWFCSVGGWMRNLLIVWGIVALWYNMGWNALLCALWFAVLLALEKWFLRELLGVFPGVIGWLYTMVAVLVGWVLLEMGSAADISAYLRAMFDWTRINAADAQGMFLLREYGIQLTVGALAMLPVGAGLWKRLEENETGAGIAVWRFCNVVFPTALLLFCIAYIL